MRNNVVGDLDFEPGIIIGGTVDSLWTALHVLVPLHCVAVMESPFARSWCSLSDENITSSSPVHPPHQ